MERQGYIDRINNLPVSTFEVKRAMGNIGQIMALIERATNRGLQLGLKEGIKTQKEITQSVERERFKRLLKDFFKLKEKRPMTNEDVHSHADMKEKARTEAFNSVVRYMRNRVEKLIFILDSEK